jgi:hypothetical protein
MSIYIKGIIIVTDNEEIDEFKNLIGKTVRYISKSGKSYEATIIKIPVNPYHQNSKYPTVSLEFRNEIGKLVRKERVLPIDVSIHKTQVWVII